MRADSAAVGAMLASCGLFALGCEAPPASTDASIDASAPPPPMVETESGPIVGARGDGVLAFLGVPYAAPPVGPRRWRAPEPPEPWSEPRDTTARPPACTQRVGTLVSGAEDCLYVNVHAPDPLPSSAPVMVWIHGGSFAFGQGLRPDEVTTGDVLARTSGVVVVSMNYRLGPLGFLAHPALTAEGGPSGSYGIADQIEALRWVRDNIAAFGGDPENVTIFGESAGGLSVCLHLVSPESAGLFARAIVQSGLCDTALPTIGEGEADGASLASALGCTEGDALDCLRAADDEAIAAFDPAAGDAFAELFPSRAFWPHVGGALLPADFRARVEAGAFSRVPTIVGWNADEGTVFALLTELGGTVLDEAAYEAATARIAEASERTASEVRARYPLSAYADPAAAIAAALGDALIVCPSRRAARLLADRGVPVRAYRFTYPDASWLLPTSRALGAFHAAEIQFVFGHPARGRFDDDELALHESMRGYWTRFAARSDPNTAAAPSWPAYDAASDGHLVLDRDIAEARGAGAEACAFWDP